MKVTKSEVNALFSMAETFKKLIIDTINLIVGGRKIPVSILISDTFNEEFNSINIQYVKKNGIETDKYANTIALESLDTDLLLQILLEVYKEIGGE